MSLTGRTAELNIKVFDDDDISSGDDFADQADAIENQLVNLATAWGEGVIGEDSWEVDAGTGLSVTVSAGRGILDTFAGYTSSSTTVSSLTDDATSYIWVRPHHDGSETDQAWHLTPTFEAKSASTGYTGMVLAEVVCASGAVTTITDMREFIGQEYLADEIAEIATDVAWIAAALGTDYADYSGTPPDPIDDRLDALEATLGGGGVDTLEVFWGLLEKSESDATTIVEYIEAWWATKEEARQGGLVTTDWDNTTCATMVEIMRQVHLSGQSACLNQLNLYVFDAAMSPSSLYDTVNTTATVDRELGVIR